MDVVNALSILDQMKDAGKRAFYMREFAAFKPDQSTSSAAMTLTRLRKRGIVDRCENVWFITSHPPDLFEIGRMLEPIGYMSLESALFERNVLSQSPRSLTMVIAGKPRILQTDPGNIIFHHIKKRFFLDLIKIGSPTLKKRCSTWFILKKRMG